MTLIDGPLQFGRRQKLEAIERELRLRRRVYPRFIEQSKLSKKDAEYQLAVFEAIAADYRRGGEL